MIIKWRGKIGYGDIVSPISYAINQAEISNSLVNLQFYWGNLNNKLLLLNYQRCKQLVNMIDHPQLVVDHLYLSLDTHHVNYTANELDPNDVYHNVYFYKHNNVAREHLVISSPISNKKPLSEHGIDKEWKSGLDNNQWKSLIDTNKHIYVDYDTPFDELIDILSRARYYIGYHGSVSWIAKLLGCPMTVYSSRKNVTRWCFPWSLPYFNDLDKCVDESTKLLNISVKQRNEYIERLRGARS